jgi:hypothetical protein
MSEENDYACAELEDEILFLEEEIEKLKKQKEIMLGALKEICKSKYGVQGYAEEDDLVGERDYLSRLSSEYEDTAREALKKVEWME